MIPKEEIEKEIERLDRKHHTSGLIIKPFFEAGMSFYEAKMKEMMKVKDDEIALLKEQILKEIAIDTPINNAKKMCDCENGKYVTAKLICHGMCKY